VDALARAAAGGPVMELGLGTGRLPLPLARHGVRVDGIEASPAMIARLRAQPGADSIGVFTADLAGFDLPRRDYAIAVHWPTGKPNTSPHCGWAPWHGSTRASGSSP
jgi:16S rRNA A1518/A1519 N6-dimethyltransferase RsmA/KsgA/DIM1 with predicted DNA glycosylase/AP lyase activity